MDWPSESLQPTPYKTQAFHPEGRRESEEKARGNKRREKEEKGERKVKEEKREKEEKIEKEEKR